MAETGTCRPALSTEPSLCCNQCLEGETVIGVVINTFELRR